MKKYSNIIFSALMITLSACVILQAPALGKAQQAQKEDYAKKSKVRDKEHIKKWLDENEDQVKIYMEGYLKNKDSIDNQLKNLE